MLECGRPNHRSDPKPVEDGSWSFHLICKSILFIGLIYSIHDIIRIMIRSKSFNFSSIMIILTIKLPTCSPKEMTNSQPPSPNDHILIMISTKCKQIKPILPWARWSHHISLPIQELLLANSKEIKDQSNMKKNNWCRCMLGKMEMDQPLIFHLNSLMRMVNR